MVIKSNQFKWKVQWSALITLMAGTAVCQLASASAREKSEATNVAAAAGVDEIYPGRQIPDGFYNGRQPGMVTVRSCVHACVRSCVRACRRASTFIGIFYTQ